MYRLLRTNAFRLAALYMALFAASVLTLLVFIYFSTADFVERQTEETVGAEITGLQEQYREHGLLGLIEAINSRASAERGEPTLYLLADPRLKRIAGNLANWPQTTAIKSGWVRFTVELTRAGQPVTYDALASVFVLNGDYRLLVGRDLRDAVTFRARVEQTLFFAALLTLALGLIGGLFMTRNVLRRIEAVNRTSASIIQGDLSERVPLTGSGDEFDQLAANLNAMLDRIERLMAGMRQVTDNIAHDLRTPLTRVRARLERSREADRPTAELEAAIDVAIAGLDQTLGIITALLRITEIEEGNRRAAFGEIDLARIVCDVAELYGPIAENAHIELAVVAPAPRPVKGDRDLLVEAVANVLDNAIKFSPADSRIDLAVFDGPEGPIVRVRDRGPGIPPEERAQVLKRFYRADKSRHLPGSGLGLGVVSAVMNLHRFRIAIDDGEPGCVFDLICTPLSAD